MIKSIQDKSFKLNNKYNRLKKEFQYEYNPTKCFLGKPKMKRQHIFNFFINADANVNNKIESRLIDSKKGVDNDFHFKFVDELEKQNYSNRNISKENTNKFMLKDSINSEITFEILSNNNYTNNELKSRNNKYEINNGKLQYKYNLN